MWFGTLALLFVHAQARALGKAPPGHEYIAPGPNDVPQTTVDNDGATHRRQVLIQSIGFIPRSGKNITVAQVAAGLKEGLNVGLDFGTLVGQTATLSNPDPLAGTFNMDQLRQHNFPLEHDVSLSRQDYYRGDDLNFNQTVFNQVLAYYKGMTHTTIPVAVQAQWNRVKVQRALNGAKEIYGPRQLVLALAETALYMSVMGNPITGDAPISYVKSFFEQARLPYELGWTAPTIETNFPTLAVMAGELLAADPGEAAANFPAITVDLLQDAFELKDPLTGVVCNATAAAVGLC